VSWRPLGVSRRYSSRPSVGDVVAIDHRAWEVTHVIDAIPTAEEEARLNAYRAEYREKHLPYKVSLKRLHGPRHENENSRAEVGYRVPVGAFGAFPQYKDGRVPLCSCHGHPWPCLEAEQQRYAEAELAKAEKALRVLPGCCPACGEVVTHRQKSITFGGPNVSNPLAEGPTYHLRRKVQTGRGRVRREVGQRRARTQAVATDPVVRGNADRPRRRQRRVLRRPGPRVPVRLRAPPGSRGLLLPNARLRPRMLPSRTSGNSARRPPRRPEGGAQVTGCNWNRCGQPGRPYLVGIRCPQHTPAALAGRHEPQDMKEE